MIDKKILDWSVDDWHKVVFSDESKVYIGAGDGRGNFIWPFQIEKENKNCLGFLLKFPNSIMILRCMPF